MRSSAGADFANCRAGIGHVVRVFAAVVITQPTIATMTSSRFLPLALAATFVVSSAFAQTPTGPANPANPQPYAGEGCALAHAFHDIATTLQFPFQLRTNVAKTCVALSSEFQAAAGRVTTLRNDLALVGSLEPAHASEVLVATAALDSIALGFAGIAVDFADADADDSLAYWAAADGFTQLAGFLAFLNQDLADAGVAAMSVANLFADMSVALAAPSAAAAATYHGSLFALAGAVEQLADACEVQVPSGLAPAAPGSVTITCPVGTYPDCETNTWETKSGPSCGIWTRFCGGLDAGVVTFCPDGGLWRRICTYTITEWAQMVCCCYESRWDRFWGIGGFGHVAGAAVATGTSTEEEIENEWTCSGAPGS